MKHKDVTIIILDYGNSDVDIIHHAPVLDDYQNWLSTHCQYNPDNIAWMVLPGNKAVAPNHFTPEDFN